MKKILWLVCFVVMFGGCSSKVEKIDPKIMEETPKVIKTEAQSQHFYQIDVTLDTAEDKLVGKLQMEIHNQSQDDWDRLYFRDYTACDVENGVGMKVENVSDGVHMLEVHVQEDSSILEIPLQTPLKAGETMQLSLAYTAYFNQEAKGRFSMNKEGDFLQYTMGNFYPVLSYYENGVWQNHPFVSLGECFYTPISDYQVSIEVPQDFVVCASGEQQTVETNDETQIYHFKAQHMRDFALSASNQYQVLSLDVDGITVNSYFFQGQEEKGRLALEEGVRAMAFFNRYLALYPYPTINIVEVSHLPGGGMEFPGYIMIIDNYYEAGYKDQSIIKTVVHELAHQWFYGLVGNDQYSCPWIDESTASALTSIYQMYQYPAQYQIESERNEEIRNNQEETLVMTKDVSGYGKDNEGVHQYVQAVYTYGQVFFLELRDEMGEENFRKMMQAVVQKYAYKEMTTRDFMTMIDQYCEEKPNDLYTKYFEAEYLH